MWKATHFMLVFLHASQAFKWNLESQNDGSIHRCTGFNVTFPWNYVTERDDEVLAVTWFSNKNGTFASYFANRYMTSSSRVTLTGNAEMTLHDVRKEDDDTYGVSVKLYGKMDPLMQNVTLTVTEPPRTPDGHLHVELDEHSYDSSHAGDTSSPHMRLKCGKFLSLGAPPVSVLWTDPSGRHMPSTSFIDGYFYLNLPHHAKGGNYTCSLPPDAEATKCIPSDSSMETSVTHFVETVETVVAEQTEGLKDLRSTMDILSEKLDELSRSFFQEQAASSRAVEDLLKRLADLEKANERLLRTTENQDTLIAVLQEQLAEVRSQQNNLTDLVQRDTETLHALVDDQAATFKDKTDHLEELYQGLSKNEENQENELSVLRGELQNLTRRVQTEERSRANSAENLQTQMDGISKTLRTQTDAADQATRSLQGRVGTLESRTTRGEATVSELQGQTEELKTLSEKLQKTAAFHTFLDKRDVTAKKPIAFNLLRVVGGGYDSDTGIYTAPFSGWYAFHVQLFPHSSADKDIWMDLYHNSEKVARGVCHQKASGGSFTCRTGITMHVTSGDTLWVQSFYGGPYWVSPFDNFFSGVLVRPD